MLTGAQCDARARDIGEAQSDSLQMSAESALRRGTVTSGRDV